LIAVFLRGLSVSQIYILSSVPADASLLPSEEKDKAVIRPVWNVHFEETRVDLALISIRMILPVACEHKGMKEDGTGGCQL
jgi:hypothetical protein